LDFNASALFSDPVYNIEPATVHQLCLQDPRVVKTYISKLHDLLESLNVFLRLDKLQETLDNQQWTPECAVKYESLERVITESMLTAEKASSKHITTTYQWSLMIKKAVQRLQYWHLRLRQVHHKPVSEEQLQLFQMEGEIPPEEIDLVDEKDIKKAQHEAYNHLKELQAQHAEL
jgi:hypothetical protein